jgi:hypothetical protein
VNHRVNWNLAFILFSPPHKPLTAHPLQQPDF